MVLTLIKRMLAPDDLADECPTLNGYDKYALTRQQLNELLEKTPRIPFQQGSFQN